MLFDKIDDELYADKKLSLKDRFILKALVGAVIVIAKKISKAKTYGDLQEKMIWVENAVGAEMDKFDALPKNTTEDKQYEAVRESIKTLEK